MQLQDVEKLIQNGEFEAVEFKAGFNKETNETVVAFSNTRGGVIIIGADNQGNMKRPDINSETLKDWAIKGMSSYYRKGKDNQ